MSAAGYVYVVSDELGVRYATDRRYAVAQFFDREHRPGAQFRVTSCRWDGRLREIDPGEFITSL